MPGDLLLVPGGVLAVGALVEPRAPMRAEVLLQHQLMAAGELAVAALQRLVRPTAAILLLLLIILMLLQEMLRQQLPGPASERAQPALVA